MSSEDERPRDCRECNFGELADKLEDRLKRAEALLRDCLTELSADDADLKDEVRAFLGDKPAGEPRAIIGRLVDLPEARAVIAATNAEQADEQTILVREQQWCAACGKDADGPGHRWPHPAVLVCEAMLGDNWRLETGPRGQTLITPPKFEESAVAIARHPATGEAKP